MNKAFVTLILLLSTLALCALNIDISALRDGRITPELQQMIADNNRLVRSPSFTFTSSPYNLPDTDDIADPLTGEFFEDQAWTKDFTRHISNPESSALTLSFLSSPVHFTVSQPDPGNALKLQFQPIPGNWNGSELLILVVSDGLPGDEQRTEAMAIIRLNVTSVQDPPVWSGLPAANTFYTNEEAAITLNFQDYVSCTDSESTNFDLFVAPAAYPVDVSQAPPATGYLVTFTPQLHYFGTATYEITAVDRISNAYSTRNILITVNGVNDPPVIESYLPATLVQNIDQGSVLAFSAVVQDVESDLLTYTWTLSGLNGGVPYSTVVSTSTGLEYTFNLPGTHTLDYVVSDGTAADTMQWTINVSPYGPVFAPLSGTYDHSINVTLTPPSGFAGADIHYTLDGSAPTVDSPLYTAPIELTTLQDIEQNVTIRAFYTYPGFPPSQIASQSYVITGTVSDPVFDPAGGVFYVQTEVVINCSNQAASVYYTLDGSNPVPGNPGTTIYSIPIMVSTQTEVTIKAIAVRPGWLNSSIAMQTYRVTGVVVIDAHVMTPPPLSSGEYYMVEPGETLPVQIAGLTLLPPSSTLYYTLDNSMPGPDNPSSSIYTPGQQILLAYPTWITLRAYLADWSPSTTYSYYYDVRTRTKMLPTGNGTVFDPAPGVSTMPITVSINTQTLPAGAAIYFTTDGSDPEVNPALLYSSPIPIVLTTTIKTLAQYPGLYPSTIHSGVFQITGTVDTPAFDPASGSYSDPINLMISTLLSGTSIYYSLNGTDPSDVSPTSYLYSGLVPLGVGEHHIRARAYKENWETSQISDGYYSIGVLPAPLFDLASGLYFDPIVVHLSVSTVPVSSIYYTTDGSDPSTGSSLYDNGIGIPIGAQTSLTIKAIAWKAGWVTSEIATHNYQVTGTVAMPTFAPDGGVYASATSVSIATTTPGATIRYTLDGLDPTESYGYIYTVPLNIISSTTLKALAYLTDLRSSDVYGAVYTIFGNIADPVFTPDAGTYTTPISVYISVNPPDATVFYTTDGSIPSSGNGFVYAVGTPVVVSTSTLLRAIALKTGWNPSAIVDAQYYITGTVSAPLFTPPSGQYALPQLVTISANPPESTIIYTLDGSEPSLGNGTVYSGAVNVTSNVIIKAIAYLNGWDDSPVSSASYVINGAVGTPVFNPAAGYYNTPQTVTISAYPATATIRYTLDGSMPSLSNGNTYSSPFSIDEHTQVKAYAYLSNWLDSELASGEYFFVVSNPALSLPSGIYPDAQILSMSVTTSGANIRYTVDGSEPSPVNGTVYTIPLVISASSTVKAIAYRNNWISSNVISQTYVINGPVADPIFTVTAGNYYADFAVGISTLPAAATIYYTTDGTDPSQLNGTIYAIPIPISQNTTLKARAYLTNWLPSNISTVSYNLFASPVSITPNGGTFNANQSVILSTITAGATISYTLNGSDPIPGVSSVYNPLNPILVDTDLTLKAIASRTNWYSSSISSAAFVIDIPLPTVATPQILPASGVYNQVQTVTMSTSTLDATIRYTSDGSDPSISNGTIYAGSFIVSDNVLIKARAFKDGYNPSLISSAQYIIVIPIETVATPDFAPDAGIYTEPIQVTITTQTPNATIRYSIDGTEPSETIGLIYTSPINITETATIKAIAYKTGMNTSLISNASYVINIIVPVVAAPMFSHPSGTYQQEIDVAISTTTQDAIIRYTIDGSVPSTTNGIIYSAPIHIPVDSNRFIQAIAYKDGWTTSSVVSANYTVTGTVADVSLAPAGGVYTQATSVILSSATAGANIRYTLDGSQPTETSTLYNTAIIVPLNTTWTISARAFKSGWIPSSIVQNTYVITGQVTINTPVFSVPSGTYTTAQSVSINNPVPSDAVIHFTTDGSDPVVTSPAYSSPILIPLNTSLTIKVRAFKDNWISSSIYSSSYLITGQVILPAVVFSPQGGIYQTVQSVQLNTPTLPTDATLRYTLDGSEPSLNSPAYQNPINLALNSNTTIKVKGFRTDWIPSLTVSATYQITGQVVFNTPAFSPAPGVYTTAQIITINSTVPSDAMIRYTTDGSDPVETSTQYTTGITLPVETAMTLKVRAFKANWTPSTVQTGVYTTTGSVSISLPVFSPAPGMYTTPQSIAINTVTIPTGATLRYTLDGSDPNETSALYSTPVAVANGQTVTIRVRAYYPSWIPSTIYTGVFSVTGQVSISEPVFLPAPGTYQTAQVVTLNTITTPAGATLRYTLDGSDPTAGSPAYVSALSLGLNTITTIKVKAFLTNWLPSPTYTGIYTITGTLAIIAPVFTPAEGIYQTAQSVVISTNTTPPGATVRYTTDGSTPTATSPVYSTPVPIPLNTTMTIKAAAFLTNWITSPVYSAVYTVTGQVVLATQVFSPVAGTYQFAQTIVLNTGTTPPSATLRYTLDGTYPTENSSAYTQPIILPLNSNTTIKVVGFKPNWIPSALADATYLITGQIVFQTPVFTPEPGIYNSAQLITISGTTPSDATVHYTVDGSEPTTSSTIYTAPINLAMNTNTTLKVKAFKTDWTPSATQTGVYTITGQTSIATPVFSPAPGIYQTAQSISINSQTVPTGAQIRFTLDGSEPIASSALYTTPIPLALNSSYEIRARAFATNWSPSEVYVGYYTVTGAIAIPNPVFTPPAGLYTGNISVVLNTQTVPAGAILRYSLDGNEPNESYPQYTQPVELFTPSEVTFKVKAFKTDWLPSPTYTALYELTGQMQLMPPYWIPAPGVYTTPQSVSSVGGTNPTGGIIRYTIDGTTPTETSPEFNSPVVIGLNTLNLTLNIRAFKEGWNPSLVMSGIYTVTGQVILAESPFNPAAGTYQTAQSISLVQPVLPTGASLRYTTDGSEPVLESPTYTSPIPLPLNTITTLKVKGYADGWLPSETATAVYNITGTVSPPVFSPPGDIYGSPVQVVISSVSEGAVIRYTLDGSEPDASSEIYTEPIIVPNFTASLIITAKAFKTDWTPSSASRETYTVLSSPIDIRGFTYAGYIRVLWNLPGTTRALQGFNVYRRALTETQFEKLNIALVNTQLDGNYYYDDFTITQDVSYEYYVTAVYDGEESPASASTVEYYQSQDLDISDASGAYPNPATISTTIKIVLNRNDNVQLAISVFDFAGKKLRTLTAPSTDSNLIEVSWDLKTTTGNKVGRGTYFARVVANDGVNRSERVIKIAVK